VKPTVAGSPAAPADSVKDGLPSAKAPMVPPGTGGVAAPPKRRSAVPRSAPPAASGTATFSVQASSAVRVKVRFTVCRRPSASNTSAWVLTGSPAAPLAGRVAERSRRAVGRG
jgi:hypothetical protein